MASMMSHADQGISPIVDGEAAMTESERFEKRRRCCMTLHGNKDAVAINYLSIARGAILISNFYLTSSLIHLACRAAGGFGPDDVKCVNNQVEIYGMKPAALISNMVVISEILFVLFMPVIGAIIDYTTQRRMAGIVTAVMLAVITGIQIATVQVSDLSRPYILLRLIMTGYQVSSTQNNIWRSAREEFWRLRMIRLSSHILFFLQQTWFAMAILQAIILAVYQFQVMIITAYYPEVVSWHQVSKIILFRNQAIVYHCLRSIDT